MDSTDQAMERAEDTVPGKRRWRRWPWIVAVIVVLLLILTPPLVNVSRLQKRIAASMSQSLGRPVHLDKVSLHLLPMPGFTLENLVVSEDPAFGNEPIIRANTVEATLRVRSLWKRRVEFSTVSFTQPSVNLVRDAEGHWNLENVLVHASHVDSAPTVQAKPGPTPRFPYIEATGGRINIKLGEEKMPFSLTDADFALWLPSPQVWRVRLEGKPARTDRNIGDPGTVRLEGSLQGAEHMDEVPIDLRASWHDAPMGEASRLVTGDDRGWRGTLHWDAALQGKLGAATLRMKVTMDDLRRADLVPAQSLDVSVSCTSRANLPAGMLENVACKMPISGDRVLTLESPSVDLERPLRSEATVEAQTVPLEWAFGWMRLFSARIPAEPAVAGTVDASVMHEEGDDTAEWSGAVNIAMPIAARAANGRALPVKSNAETVAQMFEATITTDSRGGWNVELPATPLRLGPGAELTVSAQASDQGYGFTVTGEASPAQLANIGHALPQLADASGMMLPKHAAAAEAIRPVAVTCVRAWTSGQTCTVPAPAVHRNTHKPAKRRAR
ncbi:MAG TPA: AsmA family protein [Acidobacteriaceae bacterium]|jgi:AsmA protein|nr:AsmA family protein [Acidobacteriaceae bacterium]